MFGSTLNIFSGKCGLGGKGGGAAFSLCGIAIGLKTLIKFPSLQALDLYDIHRNPGFDPSNK